MKKVPLAYTLLAVVAFALSFTNFYGVGYIVIMALAALTMHFSRTFSTLFSKYIVSVLLLLATIMIVGLASWFLQVDTYPAVVVIVFLSLTLVLNYRKASLNTEKTKFFDLGDTVSAVVALLIPFIIFVGYLTPYSNAALYQLLSNGWDNAAHIVMLETASIENSYVYGNLEEVQHRTINKTNAYPQAWHLATSSFADGFGHDVFDPQQPILVLKSYAIVMAIWFAIGAFCASKVAWVVTKRIRKKTEMPNWLFIALFVLLNIFTQLFANAGSMLNGFASYLGILAFTALLVSCLIDADFKKPNRSLLIVALIACTAGALCWFLPWPALLISVVLLLLNSGTTRSLLTFLLHNKILIILSALLVAAIIAQIILFETFTYESGAELLTTNGGAYKVSELLIGLLLLTATLYLYKNHKTDLFMKFLITLCPLILMIIGIYTYQLIVSEQLTYYYYKLTMLLGLMMMTFVVPVVLIGFDTIYKKLNNSTPMTLMVIPTLIGLVFLISQQTLKPFHFILQGNSNVTYSTSRAIIKYLENEDPKKTKVIVMTNRMDERPAKYENANGDLVSSVAHLPYTCAYTVFNNTGARGITPALKRLARCADETKDEILVITNFKTKELVQQLNKPNIRIVTVK